MADQGLEGSQPVDLQKHPSGIVPTLQWVSIYLFLIIKNFILHRLQVLAWWVALASIRWITLRFCLLHWMNNWRVLSCGFYSYFCVIRSDLVLLVSNWSDCPSVSIVSFLLTCMIMVLRIQLVNNKKKLYMFLSVEWTTMLVL